MMVSVVARMRLGGIFLIVSALSGCADLTHYNYQRTLLGDSGSAIYSDAKQRAVLAAKQPERSLDMLRDLRNDALQRAEQAAKDAAKADEAQMKKALSAQHNYYAGFANNIANMILSGNFAKKDMRVVAMCAEPSPDALSALAASGGIAAEIFGQGEGQLQAALAESAGSIGLRTQSIQLMRDAMYRLCEGYMNGALGNAAFETLHRRFQNSMVAILAIEQLTGVVRPPTVVLAASSAVGAADSVQELTDKVIAARGANETAKKKVETKKTALEAAEGAETEAKEAVEKEDAELTKLKQCRDAADDSKPEGCQAAKPTDGDIETQQKKIDDAEKAHEEAKKSLTQAQGAHKAAEKDAEDTSKTLAYMEEAVEAARFGRAMASATGFYESVALPSEIDSKTAWHISKAVTSIVDSYYNESYIDEVCTTIITSMTDGEVNREMVEELQEVIEFSYETFDDSQAPPEWKTIDGTTNLIGICKSHIAEDIDRLQTRAKSSIENAASARKEAEKMLGAAQDVAGTANETIVEANAAIEGARVIMALANQREQDAARATQDAAPAFQVVSTAKDAQQLMLAASEAAQAAAEARAASLSSLERQSDACLAYRRSGVIGLFRDQEARERCLEAEEEAKRLIADSAELQSEAERARLSAESVLERAGAFLENVPERSSPSDQPADGGIGAQNDQQGQGVESELNQQEGDPTPQ